MSLAVNFSKCPLIRCRGLAVSESPLFHGDRISASGNTNKKPTSAGKTCMSITQLHLRLRWDLRCVRSMHLAASQLGCVYLYKGQTGTKKFAKALIIYRHLDNYPNYNLENANRPLFLSKQGSGKSRSMPTPLWTCLCISLSPPMISGAHSYWLAPFHARITGEHTAHMPPSRDAKVRFPSSFCKKFPRQKVYCAACKYISSISSNISWPQETMPICVILISYRCADYTAL